MFTSLMKAAGLLLVALGITGSARVLAGTPPPPASPATPVLIGPSEHQDAARTTEAVLPDTEDLRAVKPAAEKEKPQDADSKAGDQQ